MSDLLKNKLSNYEVTPPAAAWNNISAELNEHKPYLPVAEMLYNYEVEPPVAAWPNISVLLKTKAQPPVRNLRSLVVKLAAAAVLLGLILVTSLYFMHQETSEQNVTADKTDAETTETKKDPAKLIDEAITPPQITASLPTISFPSTQKVRTGIRERLARKTRTLEASLVKPDYSEFNQSMSDIAVQVSLIRNERGDIIQAPRIIRSGYNDEYISVTGPNGQQTRISAKFADVLLYLNKNENLQDQEWQRKFEDWRGKIMQTSFIPSSNNFLDILELKDFILKDNQQ